MDAATTVGRVPACYRRGVFPLRFDFGRPGASIAVRAILGRRFGAYALHLDGLRFDNRFIPAVSGARQNWRLIVFPTAGSLCVRNAIVPPGSILLLPQTLMSSSDPAHWVTSRGSAVSLAAVRIPPGSLVDGPTEEVRVVAVSEATSRAFRDLAEPTCVGDTSRALTCGAAVFDELVRDGVARTTLSLADEQEGRTLAVRTMEAAFPLLSSLATQPMLVDIIARAGVGERQFLRNIQQVQAEFDLPDRGWRETIVRWRVTAAVLLLSSDELTLTDVARLAGYSGSKTMGRALSEAGLPQGSVIRKQLRDAA